LWYRGLSLPRIYAENLDLGLILQEDLGDLRLDALFYEKGQDPGLMNTYRRIIQNLASLHQEGTQVIQDLKSQHPEPYDRTFAFTEEFQYFLKGLKLLNISHEISPDALKEGENLTSDATGVKSLHGFIHRDLQSRNIMLKDSEPYFIDWQGGREGPVSYDLASLLYDPYVTLDESFRSVLMELYHQIRGSELNLSLDAFRLEVRRIAILRLMQAFGAYAKLSVLCGKAEKFQGYLAPALERIKFLLSSYFSKDYPALAAFLSSLPIGISLP
ncbi:MAG: phosphotransferase, partial [Deltaproteobacteria bacterium]|nr:phosphotransferase [Deltaproteobacteria bacterium]